MTFGVLLDNCLGRNVINWRVLDAYENIQLNESNNLMNNWMDLIPFS